LPIVASSDVLSPITNRKNASRGTSSTSAQHVGTLRGQSLDTGLHVGDPVQRFVTERFADIHEAKPKLVAAGPDEHPNARTEGCASGVVRARTGTSGRHVAIV